MPAPDAQGAAPDAQGAAPDAQGAAPDAQGAAPDAQGAAPPAGVLLLDKPVGWTSHDVVAAVRGRLAGVKTGHAGTLDPFATGLLVVLLGPATRLQSKVMELPKSYETTARLGARSSTGDPEGEIEITGRVPPDPPTLPTGTIRQRPPIHSAVKIGGERAYRRARRGERFEMPERIVTVHRFEQTARDAETASFAIECSSGTYVRSLIADLGDAYCVTLRRTAIGPFLVQDAIAPPQRGEPWQPPPPIPVQQVLALLQ